MFSAVVRQPSRWNIRAPSSSEEEQLVFKIIAAAHNLRSPNDQLFEHLDLNQANPNSQLNRASEQVMSAEHDSAPLNIPLSSQKLSQMLLQAQTQEQSEVKKRYYGPYLPWYRHHRRARHPLPLKLS